ncbi:DNA-J protein [Trypanosoma conorhini]|uniref:DNA-J protein n=1 Tax=Trypanosoma conorhini TaxID=83891 RepID=A0A3R7LVB1_9TRYP|nr:DNA-J protein [Trypanosoma conorhini]RNF21337.1 DNA-J protein [Trypanosoma conorhini]
MLCPRWHGVQGYRRYEYVRRCGTNMYYRTLGVKRRATQEEIRKAFRSTAVQMHPDKPGGSVELFQALQTAYEVLSNEKKRALYDAELAKQRSKLRGFKRPPALDNIRSPVHYKLADGEYYAFETAPDCLKCRFKHGDIISYNDKLGCFIGLGGDDYLYWRPDDQAHASRLCQKGSFGVDSVKVVVRANFKPSHSGYPPSSLPPRAAGSAAAGTHGAATNKGRPGQVSKAEQLRQDIIRRERERRCRECIAALVEDEKKQRVRLVEKIEADMEDERQSFRDWRAAGDLVVGVEEPAWITHAKPHAAGKQAGLQREGSAVC